MDVEVIVAAELVDAAAQGVVDVDAAVSHEDGVGGERLARDFDAGIGESAAPVDAGDLLALPEDAEQPGRSMEKLKLRTPRRTCTTNNSAPAGVRTIHSRLCGRCSMMY